MRLSIQKIDIPGKGGLCADRYLYRNRHSFQALSYHVDTAPEVGSGPIHFVNETDSRNVKAIRLPPDRLGLGLDTLNRIENHHAAIQHPQAALDLGSKIDVPGRIDNVNAVVPPEAGDRRRGNRDAALALLLHPVGDGGAIIHVAHPIRLACIEQDPLGGRRLARINVGDDAYVTDMIERLPCLHRLTTLCYEPPSKGHNSPRWLETGMTRAGRQHG